MNFGLKDFCLFLFCFASVKKKTKMWLLPKSQVGNFWLESFFGQRSQLHRKLEALWVAPLRTRDNLEGHFLESQAAQASKFHDGHGDGGLGKEDMSCFDQSQSWH